MEIKTSQSLKSVIKALRGVTDARLLNTLTGEEIVLRTEIEEDTKALLDKLELPH